MARMAQQSPTCTACLHRGPCARCCPPAQSISALARTAAPTRRALQVPLTTAVRVTSDSGAPIVVSDARSPAAAAYGEVARRVYEKLQAAAAPQGPTITVS